MLTVCAAFLNRCLLIRMLYFLEYGEMSSDVASRIMAVTASHRLMSKKDRGNCIFTPYFVLFGGM